MQGALFLLLFIQPPSVQAQTNTDWQKEGLKGKIKSVKKNWTYRYKSDGKNFTPWTVEDGTLISFSGKGQIMAIQYLKKGTTLTSTSKYTYKPGVNEYEIRCYRPDGRASNSTAYKTDRNGNILEEARFDSAGKLRDTYKYFYDEKSNMLSSASYDAYGAFRGKTTYSNNSSGKKTIAKTETQGYATTYRMYEYDAKGNISAEEWPAVAGLHSFRFERTYDDRNNKIREVKYIDSKPKAYLSTWRYEYDSKGNWVKQTEYTGEEEPFSVYERTIIYY